MWVSGLVGALLCVSEWGIDLCLYTSSRSFGFGANFANSATVLTICAIRCQHTFAVHCSVYQSVSFQMPCQQPALNRGT